jgi:cytochrome c556
MTNTRFWKNFGLMLVLGVFIAGCTGTARPILSDLFESPEVNARKGVMRSMSKAWKGVKGAVKKGDMKAAGKAAKKLYNASKKIKKAFKKKGNAIVTRALPSIWKNKGKFNLNADGLGANAAVFAQIWSKSSDKKKVGAAMKRIGKSCGGCHKAFRAKKKK